MIDVDRGLEEVSMMLRAAALHKESDSVRVQNMRARDLFDAARLLDELRYGPGVQLTVGENPLAAYTIHKMPYDFYGHREETVEPGHVEQFRWRYNIQLNPLSQELSPAFGQFKYFSLDAIGRTLREGGALTVEGQSPSTNAGNELTDHTS